MEQTCREDALTAHTVAIIAWKWFSFHILKTAAYCLVLNSAVDNKKFWS